MGIPHFEDLALHDILDALDLRWTTNEKMDGSWMEFGLDDDGRYFSRRKGGPKCYSINDWPAEGWTNAFRVGHQACEEITEFLQERYVMAPGTRITCEVLFGDRPNTIPYANTASIAIISWSFSKDLTVLQFTLNDFRTSLTHDIYHTYDGRTKHLKRLALDWKVLVLEDLPAAWTWARMKTHADMLKGKVLQFKNEIAGETTLSRGDLIKMPLNRRPGFVFPDKWPAVKEAIKETRAMWQRDIVPELVIFKDMTMRSLLMDHVAFALRGSQYSEGLVVTTWKHNTFKMVDREGFTGANKFAHWVKYNIAGGRRPKRPSFLSRTADWPIEKRLARLDVLRERYLRHHGKLNKYFRNTYKLMPVEYQNELHERTKLLFVDVRERIINGR